MRGHPTKPITFTQSWNLTLSLLLFFCLCITSGSAKADKATPWVQSDSRSTEVIDHQTWDGFLKSYVQMGEDGISRVSYGRVTEEDKQSLSTYIAMLEGVDVTRLNRSEQFAFWANLYNAVTVDLILDHYPVASIKDIKPSLLSFGPWKKERVTILGKRLSLDDVEHNILRKAWQDPRVHYALNCASLGCPNLLQDAFRSDILETQLDDAARLYVNHPRGAQIRDGKLHVASIYKWFQEDFGGTDEGVINHLKIYAVPDFVSQLNDVTTINSDSYDWALNDSTGDTPS